MSVDVRTHVKQQEAKELVAVSWCLFDLPVKNKGVGGGKVGGGLGHLTDKICYTWQKLFVDGSLFGIIYKSILCNFNITLNYWFISKTIKIRGNFILKCPLGDPGIPLIWHSFSFFSVTTIIEIISCIFVLNCFSSSYSLIPLPFLLHHYIRRNNEMGKSWSDMNSSHNDQITISLQTSNVAIHTIKLILIYFVTI